MSTLKITPLIIKAIMSAISAGDGWAHLDSNLTMSWDVGEGDITAITILDRHTRRVIVSKALPNMSPQELENALKEAITGKPYEHINVSPLTHKPGDTVPLPPEKFDTYRMGVMMGLREDDNVRICAVCKETYVHKQKCTNNFNFPLEGDNKSPDISMVTDDEKHIENIVYRIMYRHVPAHSIEPYPYSIH